MSAAVWPQFAMQTFGVQSVPSFRGNGKFVEGRTWEHRVTVKQPYLLVQFCSKMY